VQREFTPAPDALTGAAAQQSRAVAQERVKLAGETRAIERQIRVLLEQQVTAQKGRETTDRAIQQLGKEEQAIIKAVTEARAQELLLNDNILQAERRKIDAQVELRQAVRVGDEERAQKLRDQIESEDRLLESSRKKVESIRDQVDQVEELGKLSEEELEVLERSLAAQSREFGIKAQILELDEAKTKALKSSEVLQTRIAGIIAEQQNPALERSTQLLELQAGLAERVTAAEGTAGAAATRRLAAATLTLETRRQEAALAQRQTAAAVVETQRQVAKSKLVEKELQAKIAIAKAEGLSTAELERALNAQRELTAELQKQANLLGRRGEAQDRLAAAELASLERAREMERIRAEGTSGEAIALGLDQFVEGLGTVQEQLENLVTSVLSSLPGQLANGITSAFVNAFDENGKFVTDKFLEGLQQAAADILLSIAQQILQSAIEQLITSLLTRQTFQSAEDAKRIATETQIATIKSTTAATIDANKVLTATNVATLEKVAAQTNAATKITAATQAAQIELQAAQAAAAIRAGSSAAGGVGGAAEGGFIGSGKYAAFAVGGHVHGALPRVTPPPGVPRSDTVAAYLTPGEFVQKASAVRTYGLQVMDAINRRLIDPGLLKGLTGIRKMRAVRQSANTNPGFADGGLVTSQIQQIASRLEGDIKRSGVADSGPAVAVPVADEQLETMLASGKEAFRRFLRDNAGDFDGILRGGRIGS
jgi:hypothetical protein